MASHDLTVTILQRRSIVQGGEEYEKHESIVGYLNAPYNGATCMRRRRLQQWWWRLVLMARWNPGRTTGNRTDFLIRTPAWMTIIRLNQLNLSLFHLEAPDR